MEREVLQDAHFFCVALQLLFFCGFCVLNIDWVFFVFVQPILFARKSPCELDAFENQAFALKLVICISSIIHLVCHSKILSRARRSLLIFLSPM